MLFPYDYIQLQMTFDSIMENEQRTCKKSKDFYGLKISDLLPHLDRKKDPPGQHLLQSLSRSSSLSKPGDPDKPRGAPIAPLPNSIQSLAVHQACQHHQQTTPGSSGRSFKRSPTSYLAQNTEAFSKAFTELFFLPYIAAGRLGVRHSVSPAAIRDLFQQGVLSPQLLRVQAGTNKNPSSLWLALKEPDANSGMSEQYFEDLEDLQKKLFSGTLQRSACLLRPPQEPSAQRRTLRNICLSDSSMCCSPPLVCRNQIYYTSFSK
ncbi:hypothetical protein AALO_G00068950 [Alosa alosa]|uniref:Uncharacterized protein n=1 Tax=Alosa alosa TaxID=278164 RepID=A0AAV6H1R9_9TELE|nr:uncharacterized protein LOC125294992 [Alosa alosa]KAG5281239.1 hypothetical protein AALO_G00068950 [Alosa alosa]